MPVSKLKNLAILILVLANLALAAVLVPDRLAQTREAEELCRSLQALYEAQDVILSADAVPDTVNLYTLQLQESAEADLAAVTALLGEQILAQDDSTRYLSTYRSQSGACTISRSGAFRAQLEGREEARDLSRDAAKLLKNMGFETAALGQPQRLRAGVFTLTATQSFLGVPVFSDGLTLTYSNNSLTAMEGTFFISGSAVTRVGDQACITAADALMAFLSARFDVGWVGSAVTAMEQGYVRSETASAATVHLTPVWRLQTDTGAFCIDGMTGAVTPA